jgi:hypothetical protein
MVVDVLSVCSVRRLDLLDVQRRTMGSHLNVRNFFSVTELDDADPECYQKLTWEHVRNISRFCRRRRPAESYHRVYRYMTGILFAREQWLEKKANPTGWMCAQKRPYYGLAKAARHYVRHRQDLPDWLIIMDDDTYYNMELFRDQFRRRDSSELEVSVGCLVRQPVHLVNLTFPYGGFGSVISRGSLAKLFRPIECPSVDNDQAICDRLEENIVGERRYFRNGMSLVELIHAYVSAERYRDVDHWSTGYCMHSDWVLGYFVNFYNVSRHVDNPYYELVPHARIEPFSEGSEIYRRSEGLCKNDGVCREGDAVCHRTQASWMEEETNRLRQLAPHRFRNVTFANSNLS